MSKKRRNLILDFNKQSGLLRVLGVNDFMYGYGSNGFILPEYVSVNEYRGVYAPFDILTSEAGHYVVETPLQNDLYFALEFFSNAQLQQIANGQKIGGVYFTSGWRNLVYDFTLPITGQEDIAGFRILIAKGINKSEIVDSSLNPYFEIRKES